MKEINEDWVKEVLKGNNMSKDEETSKIDWVRNGKGFKKDIRFKLLPANSKENKIFAYICGMHWNLGPNQDKYFACTEQTLHLKKQGVVCPICEAKRKLLSMGFKEEDLCTQGKFGPIPVFDPTITSNVKVVVVSSDTKEWDAKHVSILQQKGSFLTRWLIEQYRDPSNPDFLAWEKSNIFKFTREKDNGTWERTPSFATYEPDPAVLQKLKEENENLTLPDVWRMPSDTDILEAKDIANKMVESYLNARTALASVAETKEIDDEVPF